MFIDSYAVRKEFKNRNSTLLDVQDYILDCIDQHQGEHKPLQIDRHVDLVYRNILWSCIQAVHKNVIVVDTSHYPQNYQYIHEKDVRKEQYAYKVFILNYLHRDFMQNLDFDHLRETVASGDKFVAFTVP